MTSDKFRTSAAILNWAEIRKFVYLKKHKRLSYFGQLWTPRVLKTIPLGPLDNFEFSGV